MRQAGGHGHHRQSHEARGMLGHVERAAAADAHHRVVELLAQAVGQLERGVQGAALLHAHDVAVLDRGLHHRGDLVAVARTDRHGHVAAARDAAVGEQLAEAGHGARADLHRHRGGEHAG